jgi:hypothetical protein
LREPGGSWLCALAGLAPQENEMLTHSATERWCENSVPVAECVSISATWGSVVWAGDLTTTVARVIAIFSKRLRRGGACPL